MNPFIISFLFVSLCSSVGMAQTAGRAADFINSMGVTAHIAQGVENDPVAVSNALKFLGVNHIRDDGSTNSTVIGNWLAIHTNTGATFSILPPSYTIATAVSVYSTLASAGALLAAEGPNEPNNSPVTYGGATSCMSGCSALFTPVAQFQRDLYAGVKAALPTMPVWASSEAGGAEPNNVGLQWLTIPAGAGTLMPDGTVYADVCNTHNYVQGNGMTVIIDNNAYGAELTKYNNTGSWDGPVGEYGPTTWNGHFTGYSNLVGGSPSPSSALGIIPCVTTETGWVTQGTNAITEDQQGKLLTNLYLDAWLLKWSYTFVYMLRDDPSQGYWGLFHQDWTPKLSANYISNLTSILADGGATARTFTPGSLAYTISGSATVHSQAFEKSDGSFWLAVWDERASGSDNVTIALPATYIATEYDPTVGTNWIGTTAGTQLSAVLSDHVRIWRLDSVGTGIQLAQLPMTGAGLGTPVSCAAPTVTAVSPSSGTTAGGTSVTLTGTNFTGATNADFGLGNHGTGLSVGGPTSISITSPSGSGTVDVRVITPCGTSAINSPNDQFTYTGGLPLDGVANLKVAYSTRQLLTAYAGAAIRVHRLTDNTEMDIGFVSNVLDTTTLAVFCVGTDCDIVKWYDQSGNATDAVHAYSTNLLPKIYISGVLQTINSQPALHIAAIPQTVTAAITANPVNTLFQNAVLVATNFTNFTGFAGGTVGSSLEWRVNQTTGTMTMNGCGAFAIGTSSGSLTATTASVVESSYNSSTGAWAFWIDAAASGTGSSAHTMTASNLTFGTSSPGCDSNFVGFIGEYVSVDAVGGMPSGSRTALEANQKTYWGTP